MSSRAANGSCSYPRVLILDINPPGWAMVRSELCEALMNTLCLAAATAPKGQLLSVYTVKDKHQCLLPLLPIRGHFIRIHSCLSELYAICGEGSQAVQARSYSLAVLDALQQNRQWAQHNFHGAALHNCFVEVTVLSTRPGYIVASELDEGLKEADLSTLRRLLVVQLSCDLEESGSGDTSPDTSKHHRFRVYDIELRVCAGDLLSLESFFKAWLLESNCERDEIHLILPCGDPKLQIICDMHRPLLPLSLLHGVLPQDGDQEQSPRGTQTLRILRLVSSQGVCGSLLYGAPSILNPTACWELDWDQLESNQEHFKALCHYLQSQEVSLVGCSSQRSMPWAPPVLSHFIVSASDSMVLLLRPVAARELTLLMKPPMLAGAVTEGALTRVQEALGGLDVDSVYNPLQINSNLYKHLQVTLSQHAPLPRPITPIFRGGRGQNRQGSFSGGKARAAVAPLPLVSPLSCKRGQQAGDNLPLKIRFLHEDEK